MEMNLSVDHSGHPIYPDHESLYSWHSLVQHIGYVALGSTSMFLNAVAVVVFFKEARNRNEIGQRPLLLASILADFFNGLAFTAAGGSTLFNRDWLPCTDNCTIQQDPVPIWRTCMQTFYTPGEIFLQIFMALTALFTAIDRLCAIATPVFYSQKVKSRHCTILLGLVIMAAMAALVTGDALASDGPFNTQPDGEHWPASACFAPFAESTFSYFYYGALCPMIIAAVIIDLVGLVCFTRMGRHRAPYLSDFNMAVRNYLPRHAFGPNNTPSPTNSVAPSIDQNRRRSTQLFENSIYVSRSVPYAMLATATNLAFFFLIPSFYFWFVSEPITGEQAPHRYDKIEKIIGGYFSCGIAVYSTVNSLIFYGTRKNSLSNLKSVFSTVIGGCIGCCLRRNANGVETTPVEVIGDPMPSQSSPISLASMAKHSRMKNKRPSIVPLAYGTTEM